MSGRTSAISRFGSWLAELFLFPQVAYAQEELGTIRLHLVGFQVTPEDQAQIQELADLANGTYYPAGNVDELTQALRQAAGVSTTAPVIPPIGGGGGAFVAVTLVASLGLAVLLVWMVRRRRAAPAPAPRVAVWGQLYVTQGQASTTMLHLDKPVITLGRDPVSDLVLFDDQASRQHVQIYLAEGAAVVYDLNSLNGTFVNGQRIAAPVYLNQGDVIVIGSTELVYRSMAG